MTPSQISVIRLDTNGGHRRIGGAETDLSSEGIAVSPDGTLVAAINMRGTSLLRTSPRYTPDATVSLLHFDSQTGVLTPLNRPTFPGIPPEGAAFDRSGRNLLVSAFQVRDQFGGVCSGSRSQGRASKLD